MKIRRKFDGQSSILLDVQKCRLESDIGRFGDRLGALWGTFWVPFGPPERTLSAQKRLSRGPKLTLGRPGVPKDAQERPKGLQEASKRPPRGLQEVSKRSPRGLQAVSKRLPKRGTRRARMGARVEYACATRRAGVEYAKGARRHA